MKDIEDKSSHVDSPCTTAMNRRRAVMYASGFACSISGVTLSRAQESDHANGRSPIRVGQIGVGHAHATKLSVYRESRDYEVVGVVEPDPQLRQQAQAQAAFRDVPWMTEEQLLNSSGLDAVLVETHVRDSLATAQKCIDAGKHVHLDKPAGASLPDYRQLLNSAEQKKLLVQMGYMYRYNPAVLLLRQFLKDGWLGDIFEVHTVMSKVVDPLGRREAAEFSGGMMFELGCHVIDLVVSVLGAPERITSFAQHISKQQDKLADNMLAVFEYPRATASVKSSAMEVEGFARRHLVVCGTAGTFHIQPLDNPTARIALAEPRAGYQAEYQEIRFPKFVRYVGDAADMVQMIRGEKTSDFTYAHDLDVQASVLAAAKMPLD